MLAVEYSAKRCRYRSFHILRKTSGLWKLIHHGQQSPAIPFYFYLADTRNL